MRSPALITRVLGKNDIFHFLLIFTFAGLFSKNEAKATKLYLILGGLFSIIIPFSNGIITNDWIWIALAKGNDYVAGTDLFWLITGIISLSLAWSLTKKSKEIVNSRPEKLRVHSE